jgi:hypothetical protein
MSVKSLVVQSLYLAPQPRLVPLATETSASTARGESMLNAALNAFLPLPRAHPGLIGVTREGRRA